MQNILPVNQYWKCLILTQCAHYYHTYKINILHVTFEDKTRKEKVIEIWNEYEALYVIIMSKWELWN